MLNQPRAAMAVLAVGIASTACHAEEMTVNVGTWANASVVVIATKSSVTLHTMCKSVTSNRPIVSVDGAFEIPANFNGVNYKGSVTLVGTIASQSMTLDLVPGTAPANSARHDVLTLNGALPSWYPAGGDCPA